MIKNFAKIRRLLFCSKNLSNSHFRPTETIGHLINNPIRDESVVVFERLYPESWLVVGFKGRLSH